MILLSVGTQFAFDRLVRTVDEWALEAGRTDVVAQVGPSRYSPKAIKAFDYLEAKEFREYQQGAHVHIAHAGMGSILTALELGKPIIIMPREHTRGEHRNAHQLATAKRFCDKPGVHVGWDEPDIRKILDSIDTLIAGSTLSGKASPQLVEKLRTFIQTDERPPGLFQRLLRRQG
jgi:UDP-N-acetylglucosamine transferase subunit ALG13